MRIHRIQLGSVRTRLQGVQPHGEHHSKDSCRCYCCWTAPIVFECCSIQSRSDHFATDMREHGVDKVLQGLPLQCVKVNIPLQIVRCVHRRLRPSLSVGIEMRRTRKPASLLRIPTLYPSLAGGSRHIVWCCLISHNHFRNRSISVKFR